MYYSSELNKQRHGFISRHPAIDKTACRGFVKCAVKNLHGNFLKLASRQEQGPDFFGSFKNIKKHEVAENNKLSIILVNLYSLMVLSSSCLIKNWLILILS